MFSTIDEAETAFYSAIEQHDIEAMRSVWMGSDRAFYVDPAGNTAIGIDAVLETFAGAFATAPFVRFDLNQLSESEPGNSLAIRLTRENVTFVADERKTTLLGANVFRRDASGWKIFSHQATRLAS